MFFLCSKIKQIFNFSKRLYKLRSKVLDQLEMHPKNASFSSDVQFESYFQDTSRIPNYCHSSINLYILKSPACKASPIAVDNLFLSTSFMR